MPLTFPAVVPSEHPTITAGRFPHVQKRSTGGRSGRIRLANVQLDAEIQLAFTNVDTALLLLLFSHWVEARGRTYDFSLPDTLFQSMNASTKARLMATSWRFKDQPKVVDICGGVPGRLLHSIEVVLRSQPRRVQSPVLQDAPFLSLPVVPSTAPGARFAATATWAGGAAGINITNAPGAALAIRVAFVGGSASAIGSTNAPGAAWSATTTWSSVGRTTPSAEWNATVAFTGGKASIQGPAPGAALNAAASFSGGAASVPPQAAGGAALNVTAAWLGGAATITGGTAPGATLNATAAWVGGAAQSIGPGATLNVTAVWVGGGVSSGTDPHFSKVLLLLPMSGANNSTIFIDQSANNFSITRNGNAVITTSNPRYGNGTLLVSGEGDYLTTPANSAFALGTKDFTIEFDVFRTATRNDQGIFTFGGTASGLYAAMDGGLLEVGVFGGDPPQISGGSIPLNTWTHVAIARSSQTLRAFISGSQVGSVSNNTNLTDNQLKIGYSYLPAYHMSGQLANFRLTENVARYTSNFTPPSGPYPTS